MLRKLGAYPRQNGLAMALRELGRIERTLFTLEWLQSTELRRRVQSGLNKGEAKNALARAVFFNRLGEMRGRSFENQRYRASGLTLGSGRVHSLEYGLFKPRDSGPEAHGLSVGDNLLQHLSPLGWEHANLTGDCVWRQNRRVDSCLHRPFTADQARTWTAGACHHLWSAGDQPRSRGSVLFRAQDLETQARIVLMSRR